MNDLPWDPRQGNLGQCYRAALAERVVAIST